MVMAKRILGVLLLGGMAYLGYYKLRQNLGNPDHAGVYLFFMGIVLFLIILAVRKILTY
jgi:hypothetical protein